MTSLAIVRGEQSSSSVVYHTDWFNADTMIILLSKVNGLPKSTYRECFNMIENLKEELPMNEESWQFLKPGLDFVSTCTDRSLQPFESLIYEDSYVPVWLLPNKLLSIFKVKLYLTTHLTIEPFPMVYEE